MALTDAQMQAMQEAKDIDTGVDTRTKEERTKEQMDALKSIGKGALFSPVTGAADIVDIGASMPDPKSGTEFMFPKYSALKETFDQLSDSGINRENVVKIIKDETGIELKGDAPELIGEIVGLPAIAATKVATALFKAVGKSADEAKQLFRTASGGDDFDGMATAVAGDVKAQTDQLIAKTDLPDTSISPNMIGLETPQGRAAVKEYTVLQSKSPNITNDELFYRTGVYKGKGGKFRYELDTTNAKLNSKSFKLKRVTDNVSGASVLSNRITLNTKDATLGNILNFDDLYQAYSKQSSIPIKGDVGFKIFKPLKNIKVVRLEDAPFPTRDTTQAAYSAADDTIYIGDASNYQELLSSILHEVQHAIQRREGFITGSDSSRFLPRNFDEKYAEVKKSVRVLQNKAKKQPKDITLKNALGTARRRMTRMKTQLQEANINYMKKYGEIEARNVEYRKKLRTEYKAEGMSDEEIAKKLRLITPEETQTYKGEPIATQDTFDEKDEFRKVLRAHDPDRQPAAKSVREGYNPEDPASRVFHLTKKDYDIADVIGSGINSDIGFHVGTAAQATARGSTNIRYDKELAEEMVKGERILPLVLKENLKPARIPDVSSFKEPTRWITDMSVAKSDKQRIKFLLDDQSDADLLAKAPKVTVGGDTYFMLPDVMRIGMDEKLWKDIILEAHRAKRVGLDTVVNQDDPVEWFNTLKRTANKNGYDSFV
ncbi:MAG TPA: hypothetical protein DCM40_29300, partial [Maribacter sp.]|nr:hypothetical protein [Maribacter sp.]